jgi:hypothetical protein
MKVTKQFLNRDYVRKHRYRTESKLRSGFVTLGRRKQTFKRLLYNCSLEIRKQYLKDELKAPMACKAKPAFFSKPSVNVYFGTNKSNNGGTMQRSSYGFGKGRGSIGLNPVTMSIHPPFENMLKLMDHVTKVVRESPRWNTQLGRMAFNSCSVKIYYRYKDSQKKTVSKTTEWHVDVTRDSNGTPKKDNSQVPDTPVATLTFGSAKNLWMRRHRTKEYGVHDSLLLFRQSNGSFFVLDGEDEKHHESDGMHWRHMSNMDRQVPDGVTFSFMFRVVKMTTEIHKESGLLVHPRVGPIKRVQFQKGEHLFDTHHYAEQKCITEEKLDKCFVDFKP